MLVKDRTEDDFITVLMYTTERVRVKFRVELVIEIVYKS